MPMNNLIQTPVHRLPKTWRKWFFTGVCGLAALQLAGCTVGPDYRPSEAPVVTSFTRELINVLHTQAPPEIAPNWWTAYGSPRINVLVAEALRRNPNVEAGMASLRVAQELVNAQKGLFYPTVQAGYSGSRQNSGNVLSSPLLTSESTLFNLHTAQLNIGFVPDVFGGNRRAVESLQASAASQRFQLEALKTTLASNVVAAAIQEHVLAEQIEIAQSAIQLAAEQLQQLKGLSAGGYSSGLDLAQQQVSFAQTAALLPPLQKQIEQTRNLLAALCGYFPEQQLPGGAPDAILTPAQLPAIVPSSLVARRPDVQAAEEQLHASNAQVGVAVANRLPQISLSANLTYSNNMLAGLLSNSNKSWGLLGGVMQPLFAGGALVARQRGAEAGAQAARAQYKNVVITAFQNVADTLYAIETDGRALAAAQDVEQANRQLAAHTQGQLDAGYTSRLVFLAAQQSFLQARLARVASNATYLGDTVSLYQALGGGWHNLDAPAGVFAPYEIQPPN